jgi:hypothetical protein
MGDSIVLVDKQDGIAAVTLNRPDKLNALNRELRLAFCQAMQDLRRDQDVRVVIITSAGRAFCVGLDLRELGTGASGIRDGGDANFISVSDGMEVPVIGAINGFARTGGVELALACDIMIAAAEAQFADTHARVGVMPGGGMSARLPRAVGIRKAKELSFKGTAPRAAVDPDDYESYRGDPDPARDGSLRVCRGSSPEHESTRVARGSSWRPSLCLSNTAKLNRTTGAGSSSRISRVARFARVR